MSNMMPGQPGDTKPITNARELLDALRELQSLVHPSRRDRVYDLVMEIVKYVEATGGAR